MKISVVSDIDSFRALGSEWDALFENSRNNTLFLRWEWMFNYYTHMCKSQELFLLLVRNRKGELKGIAPFVLRNERIITKKAFLEFIGQRYSYYLGIIANCNSRDDVYQAICDYLFDNRRRWDGISLAHLSYDEVLKKHLRIRAERYGYSCRESIQDPCKILQLSDSFDKYMACLDKRLSKKLKYYLRSIKRDFDVEVSLPQDKESLKVYWHMFLELHETRVHNRGRKTVLSNKEFQQFYYSVASNAYREGNLRLVALKLDSEVAAVLFGVVWNRTFYFLNIGYKEFSKYSLGLTLPALCIERVIKDGLQFFDFLGGGGDYKEKMGGVDKGGLHIQVVKPISGLEQMVRKIGGKMVKKVHRL